MNERMPLLGRIVEGLQDRYTANRIEWGTATKDSDSEPALFFLKKYGLKGLPTALSEARENIKRKSKYNPTMVLFVGALEFILGSAGIKIWSNKKGFWES